jgi:hypothetical protein
MALTANYVPRYKSAYQLQNSGITDNGTTIALGRNTTVTGTCGVTGETTVTSGAVTFATVAKGIVLKRGANGLCGTFIATGATPVSIATTAFSITDCVIISLNTVGGTVGAVPAIQTVTAGVGFTVAATAGDTSTYNWCVIKNAA